MLHAKRQSNQKGTVLLMALVIMTGAVVSAIGVGSLIVSSLQQTKSIDNGIVAYYAAESGVEEGLYTLRRVDTMPAAVTTPKTLTNNSSWTRTVTNRESVINVGTLAQDTFYEISLYDPDLSTTSQGIGSVKLTWTDGCSGCSTAQTTLVGWKFGGPVIWDPNAITNLYTWQAAGWTVAVPDTTKLYRFRVVAKNATMTNVRITALDGSNNPTTIPGRVRIDAVGTFGGNTQKLTALMPRGAALSGIFDYVLFSECSLVKGGGSISC